MGLSEGITSINDGAVAYQYEIWHLDRKVK